jgi:cell division protein FtsI/penicillin-binding protein 2
MAAPPTGRRRPARRRGGLLGSPKPARRGTDGRIRLLRAGFLIFLMLIGSKAVALASSSQHLTQLAQSQQTQQVALPAPRGSILDRNGETLAVGKPMQTVYATPYLLADPKRAADRLCDVLQIDRRRDRRSIERRLASGKKAHAGFAFVEREVEPALAKAAVALGIPGVGSYAEEARSYPLGRTAAQVIGFAGIDDQGLAGIELAFNSQLSGKAGSETVVRDPAGQALKTIRQTQPVPGADVRLTLDSQIQVTAENVLQHALRTSGGASAEAIVMDPHTGEVLAMANVVKQGFHGFGKDPAADRNRAVTDVYEPGSIFKLVTVSGALTDGLVTPDTRFTLPPSLTVGGREVHDAETRGTVRYSVKQIIEHSSNVGAVEIARLMHDQGLYRWVKAFGFGKPTGIDFPGEAAGIVAPVDQWSGASIGNIPMGQGIAVTAIQMATVFSAIANDGVQVRPRLVLQVGTRRFDQVVTHRVIPRRIAREDRQMLLLAVEKGTGQAAQIPGYQVAGKTGTAEIAANGGYLKGLYTSSFIGMVPAGRPRLVVLVTVHGTPLYGAQAAAPAVQKIMSFALQRLEIAP